MTGVKNEARPKVILRNLREANIFDGMSEPNMIQLYNKITNVKNILDKTRDILTTHDLRQKVAQHLDTPESEVEAFIPFYEVLDEDDEEEPRFTVNLFVKQHTSRYLVKTCSKNCPKFISKMRNDGATPIVERD